MEVTPYSITSSVNLSRSNPVVLLVVGSHYTSLRHWCYTRSPFKDAQTPTKRVKDMNRLYENCYDLFTYVIICCCCYTAPSWFSALLFWQEPYSWCRVWFINLLQTWWVHYLMTCFSCDNSLSRGLRLYLFDLWNILIL